MAISGIGNSAMTAAPPPTGNALQDASMGGMDFLQLLVEQLKHQDPMNPQDSTAFAAQLAQFTSLEQMVQMNGSLDDVSQYQASLNNMSSIGMIGKAVTVVDANVVLKTADQIGAINYTLDEGMKTVQVKIFDAEGVEVYASEPVPQDIGEHRFEWSGLNDEGAVAPDGKYAYQIVATNFAGDEIPVHTVGSYVVDGVQFVEGVTYLEVNGALLPLADVVAVRSLGAN